jgi:type IV secretion system protein VirB9
MRIPLQPISAVSPYDDDDKAARPAVLAAAEPKPVEIVERAVPLPLPGQLKPPPGRSARPEPTDPRQRVALANRAARVQPMRSGYINAMQVYPFTEGALYQVYASPNQVTDIGLQPGEQLEGSGPVAAGDTVRWKVGDTESGSGAGKRIHILVKPTSSGLFTNLVVNTDRRTYHLELHSDERTYMASVSWTYAEDQLIALRRQNEDAAAAEPVDIGVDLARLRFRHMINGDMPPWRPRQVFDDGKKVYIQFPRGIGQGAMPPLFVVGVDGNSDQIVNYRVHDNYMTVDRLFAKAELRLGDRDSQQRVLIERVD